MPDSGGKRKTLTLSGDHAGTQTAPGATGKGSREDSQHIGSLPLSTGAEVLAKAVRSQWGSKTTSGTGPLDVGFREDACQVRKNNAPANFARLRRMALTRLKQETTKKPDIQGKRRHAEWDQDYMETVRREPAAI